MIHIIKRKPLLMPIKTVLSVFVFILIFPGQHAYAQSTLPVAVQVDILKRSIVKAYTEGNTSQVLTDMERYHTLASNIGLTVPGALLFIEAKVASMSLQNVRAEAALSKYFEVVDSADPRYNEALELYPRVQAMMDAEVAEKKRQQVLAEQQAQAERLKAVQPLIGPMLEQLKTEMVVIPAGKFRMGCSRGDRECYADEKPEREVSVRSFRISKYEVTFAQYDIFAEASGRELPGDAGWGRANRPVVNVRWEDAQAYTQWLSEQMGLRFRLPSEAEWEYAARAGSKAKYSWGNSLGREKANCSSDCVDAFDYTAPVGSFPANAFGLFDMHGNVWEWVQDNYHESYDGAPVYGTVWAGGDASRRVLRGGSWKDVAGQLRASARDNWGSTDSYGTIGFRVAQDL